MPDDKRPLIQGAGAAPPGAGKDVTSQLDDNISVTDLYTIGIGPSSSHTVGPMRAARRFVDQLEAESLLDVTHSLLDDLYGSLALPVRGQATDSSMIHSSG